MRFGTPWRTFWGYINGYSESLQKLVPPKQKINRDREKVGNLNKSFICWTNLSSFKFLIVAHGKSCIIGHLLNRKAPCNSG